MRRRVRVSMDGPGGDTVRSVRGFFFFFERIYSMASSSRITRRRNFAASLPQDLNNLPVANIELPSVFRILSEPS